MKFCVLQSVLVSMHIYDKNIFNMLFSYFTHQITCAILNIIK